MWSRISNLAHNVQSGLDTVVDNVNKSMTEEEAAAAAAEVSKLVCLSSCTDRNPCSTYKTSFILNFVLHHMSYLVILFLQVT